MTWLPYSADFRCGCVAQQRDHVFHPEMNYSQTQLDQLDRLTERWVADRLQKGKTLKKDKELVTLECRIRRRYTGVKPGSYCHIMAVQSRWLASARFHRPRRRAC